MADGQSKVWSPPLARRTYGWELKAAKEVVGGMKRMQVIYGVRGYR